MDSNVPVTSYFTNGSPVYFNISISGTPNIIDENNGHKFYGEVNYLNNNSSVLIWFSHHYKSAEEAYTDCYRRMMEYIKKNPVIEF